MVNTGQPSRGCAICKKRKIKCDRSNPACSRCVKSGWTCPGYPPVTDITFRDQTALVLKHSRPQRTCSQSYLEILQDGGHVRSTLPSVSDRAIGFFFYQYVCAVDSGSPIRGNHEYLPVLLRQEEPNGVLGNIIRAAGLAALANAWTSNAWMTQAYRSYGSALRQLQAALEDPVKVKSDHTLAAVMLMGIFEAIAYANADSMASFSHHTLAAARCIELRGPDQFRSEAAGKLFLQMRRIIVMTCHQLQEPIPYALKRWSLWAERHQPQDENASNRFSEINELLAAVRAEIKSKDITNPSTISLMLLPVDDMIEAWKQNLPKSWGFKSYHNLNSANSQSTTFDSQYDMYCDLWVAAAWNNYRMVRLVIHETISAAVLKYGSPGDMAMLQSSAKILIAMADGVCHSVPFHLGFRHTGAQKPGMDAPNLTESLPTPGGYLLLWPLFLSGMLRTSSKERRLWIAKTMREMGLHMGLRLAVSMAELLEIKTLSFSHDETWFIGEFYPR